MPRDEALKLENQFCFPLYAASRVVTKMYQPFLKEMGLTYPQYLILLVLWEEGPAKVMELGEKLLLSSNTLTPLLKRMEKKGILKRVRSEEDERIVMISLTAKGRDMKKEASRIPEKMAGLTDGCFPPERIKKLRDEIKGFIEAYKNI